MEDIEILLEKLADGTITATEESYLFEWLRHHKDEWSLLMYSQYRQALEQRAELLSGERSSLLLQAIHARINPEENAEPFKGDGDMPRNNEKWKKWRLPVLYLGAAASLLLLVLTGPLFRKDKESRVINRNISVAEAAKEIVNDKEQVFPVVLPDGSSVLLYPKSKLRYRLFTDTGSREVTLEGKAFFEVFRNPDQPFLVHTDDMVTKVLGTSFMVDAYENRSQYSVTVKTGSVSVSGKKSPENQPPVTLNQNEELVFDRSLEAFNQVVSASEQKRSEEPIMKVPEEYRFRDAPVTDIFRILGRDYNIWIEADEDILANCSLTTVLKDKPLFEKLRIICEGIGQGTSFSVEQEVIVITSLGCNN